MVIDPRAAEASPEAWRQELRGIDQTAPSSCGTAAAQVECVALWSVDSGLWSVEGADVEV